MRHRALRFVTAFLLSALIWLPGSARAYCEPWEEHQSIRDEFLSSQHVVVLRVLREMKLSSPDDPQGIDRTIYDTQVVETFKGPPQLLMSITNPNTSARFDMTTGESYLAFVWPQYEGDGIYVISNCGHSGPLRLRMVELALVSKLAWDRRVSPAGPVPIPLKL